MCPEQLQQLTNWAQIGSALATGIIAILTLITLWQIKIQRREAVSPLIKIQLREDISSIPPDDWDTTLIWNTIFFVSNSIEETYKIKIPLVICNHGKGPAYLIKLIRFNKIHLSKIKIFQGHIIDLLEEDEKPKYVLINISDSIKNIPLKSYLYITYENALNEKYEQEIPIHFNKYAIDKSILNKIEYRKPKRKLF